MFQCASTATSSTTPNLYDVDAHFLSPYYRILTSHILPTLSQLSRQNSPYDFSAYSTTTQQQPQYTFLYNSYAINNNSIVTNPSPPESTYTYDRIILGILSSILTVTCLLLLVIHFYKRHNPLSFHPWFLILSFAWMLLRTIFWFAPLDGTFSSCSLFFLFYVPVSLQFFVFGLLLVWIVFVIYDATSRKRVNDSLRIWQVEAMKIPDTTTTTTASTTVAPLTTTSGAMNGASSSTATNHYHPNSSLMSQQSNYGGTTHGYYYGGSSSGGGASGGDFPYHAHQHVESRANSDKRSLFGVLCCCCARPMKKLWKSKRTKRMRGNCFYLSVILCYVLITISVLALVVTYCSMLCLRHNIMVKTRWMDAMNIVTGVGFSVLGLLLVLFGVILLVLHRKKSRQQQQVAMQNSSVNGGSNGNNGSAGLTLKLNGPMILPLIVLNTMLFLSRTIIDILPLLPHINWDTSFQHLRESDRGKCLIMLCFVLWEIIPICSVLWVLGRGWGSSRGTDSSSQAFLRNRMSFPSSNNTASNNRLPMPFNRTQSYYHYQTQPYYNTPASMRRKDSGASDSYADADETEWESSDHSEMTESYSDYSGTPQAKDPYQDNAATIITRKEQSNNRDYY